MRLMIMSGMLLFVLATSAWAQGEMAMKDNPAEKELSIATFAGGCFWCMESPFDRLPGVKETIVGYAGGHVGKPTYEEVSSGKTGHAEAVQVYFDPQEISYEELLDVFWRNIDPTALNRQFYDVGTQYRTAIFYHNEQQKKAALKSLEDFQRSGKFGGPIVTQIVAFNEFFPAEEYHQDYYRKNPSRYKTYRFMSGRDKYLEKIWGKSQKAPREGARPTDPPAGP